MGSRQKDTQGNPSTGQTPTCWKAVFLAPNARATQCLPVALSHTCHFVSKAATDPRHAHSYCAHGSLESSTLPTRALGEEGTSLLTSPGLHPLMPEPELFT